MDVAASPVKKSEIEFSVTLPFAEFEPSVKRAAILISEERDFEGFRRGKAPFEIVKRTVGEHAIYERAADIAVRQSYPKALESALDRAARGREKHPTPIGHPEITVTKLAPGNELLYKAKISLLPEVRLPDYKAIAARTRAKEAREVSVSDAEVTSAITWLRESRAAEVAVARPAREGDAVEIDFDITAGSTSIDGGNSHNHPIVIGKKKFIPGFEEKLVGMTKGEEKRFSLTVPDSWHDERIRGKTLEARVLMKDIRERTLPELTDEFAARIGKFSTKEELEKSIREGLIQERQEKERERARARISEAIAKEIAIEIPDLLIETELDKMLAELKSGAEGMGMQWDAYLGAIKKTVENLRSDWREEAEKRVRIAFTLREIAAKESIAPSEEEITGRANEFLSRYKTIKEAEKEIDPATLKEYTRGVLRNEKVFEFLERINE